MKKEEKKIESKKRPLAKSNMKDFNVGSGGKAFTVIGDHYETETGEEGTCQLSIYLRDELVAHFMAASHFIIADLAEYQDEDLENTRPRDFGKVDGCVF